MSCKNLHRMLFSPLKIPVKMYIKGKEQKIQGCQKSQEMFSEFYDSSEVLIQDSCNEGPLSRPAISNLRETFQVRFLSKNILSISPLRHAITVV